MGASHPFVYSWHESQAIPNFRDAIHIMLSFLKINAKADRRTNLTDLSQTMDKIYLNLLELVHTPF